MTTVTHCPFCRIEKGLRWGLRRLKPGPFHLRLDAVLPLPFRKEIRGKFSADLFQERKLCDFAYLGSVGSQRPDSSAVVFRFGFCGDDKEKMDKSNDADGPIGGDA